MQRPAARVARFVETQGRAGLPDWPSQTVVLGPSWLFLLLFAAKYQPTLHLGPSPGADIGASWSDMKREHYGNFSVAGLAISFRKAAKGNLLCSPSSAPRARAPASQTLQPHPVPYSPASPPFSIHLPPP